MPNSRVTRTTPSTARVSYGPLVNPWPGCRSSIASAPSVHFPSFPVMRLPNCGCAIWREKKKINRRGEEPCVFNKEWALLREKNRKTLVDCHLRVVGFHLTKIRIQRDVKRERILHHEFGIEARAVFKFVQEQIGRAHV